jgi:hypothetical protein
MSPLTAMTPADPPRRVTAEAVRLEIERAIDAAARAGATGGAGRPATRDRELAGRLGSLARSAHDAGMPVERVIVLLKEAWAPQGERRVRATEPRLAALVSACIAGYYGGA